MCVDGTRWGYGAFFRDMAMVTNVTSLTGNGLKDWLLQRISAVYLAVYFITLFFYLLMHHPLSFTVWQTVFHTPWVQIATGIAMLFVSLHAWIGIWTVTTDYLKCTVLRLSVQTVVGIYLFSQLVWCFMIVWGQ